MPGHKAPSGRVIGALDEFGYLIPESIIPRKGVNLLLSNVCSTSCLGYGDETLIDPRHKLKTTKASLPAVCNREGQSGAICTGPVFGPSWVCRSCTCNFHNAICNRHGKLAPTITHSFQHAPRMLEHFKEIAKTLYEVNYTHWREEWINKWSQNKRAAIVLSLLQDLYKYDQVKSFVKREPGHKCVKKARGIQGYKNLATQASLGPQVYSLQKAYGGIFNPDYDNQFEGVGITFASGMNSEQLGAWMTKVHQRFSSPWFYERDGSNWDATMQAEHQELVNILYKDVTDAVTYENIQQCREVHGVNVTTDRNTRITTKMSYHLKETTKSGHNDTSLRNSIINAAIAFEALRQLGIEAEVIVAGDDLLIAMGSEPPCATLVALESAMGIVPEAGVMDSYQKVTFISGHWIAHDGGFSFIPLLGRLLLRLNWTATTVHPEDYHSFNYGVAQGLKPSVGGLPIYSALLDIQKPEKTTKRARKAVSEKYLRTWESEQTFIKNGEVPREVRQWFCDRYQTTPCEIASLEALIRSSLAFPCVLSHPLADRIIERDLLDVFSRG